MNCPDYEKLAFSLTSLIDQIELVATQDEVLTLCRHRFQLAEDVGLTIVFTGEPVSTTKQ